MTEPVKLDLAAIRARAMAATPGPWSSNGVQPYDIKGSTVTVRDEPPDRFVVKRVWLTEEGRCTRFLAECRETAGYSDMAANAAHIATMDPPTTIALLDMVEWLTREIQNERDMRSAAERSAVCFIKHGQRVEAEATKLRERVADLETTK